MKEKALEYLEKNSLFHMSMIFPIRRNSADIIYAEKDGVLLREMTSGAYMLTVSNLLTGRQLLDSLGRCDLLCMFQKEMSEYLLEKYSYKKCMENFQAVYTKKEHVKATPSSLEIRPLSLEYLDIIYEHYHDAVDYEYLKRRLSMHAIYGGFAGNELCGFAGTHEEGSIGILKVFENFRRRGYAEVLEGHLINTLLGRGEVPFAQVGPDNEASIRLHQKLGFELSREKLYWLFD